MVKYSKVLDQAWEIIWKHKILWLFGILAGGINEYYTLDLRNQKIWVALIIGILFLLSKYLMSIYGQVGIIQGSVMAQEQDSPLSFSDVHHKVQPIYWYVTAANLVWYLIIIIILIPVMILSSAVDLDTSFATPLKCILLPLFMLAGLFFIQVNMALVLDEMKLGAALKQGWKVFRTNLGSIIVMGLLLGIVMICAGLLLEMLGNILPQLIFIPVNIVGYGILLSDFLCVLTLTYKALTQTEGIEAEVTP